MGKVMSIAVVIVVGVMLLFGLAGAAWMLALAIPIGVVLGLFGLAMKWL